MIARNGVMIEAKRERDIWQQERSAWQKEREAWQIERANLMSDILNLTARVNTLEHIEAENAQLKKSIITAQRHEIDYLKKLESLQGGRDALIDYR